MGVGVTESEWYVVGFAGDIHRGLTLDRGRIGSSAPDKLLRLQIACFDREREDWKAKKNTLSQTIQSGHKETESHLAREIVADGSSGPLLYTIQRLTRPLL